MLVFSSDADVVNFGQYLTGVGLVGMIITWAASIIARLNREN